MNGLLSLQAAARKLRVTAKWLKAEAEADRVPHLRAGSRFLFDETKLADALKARIDGGGKGVAK